MMLSTLRPSLRALFIHIMSCMLVITYRLIIADDSNPPSLLSLIFAQGIIAAVLGIILGLRAWWIPINLAFFPLLYSALLQTIHPAWYLVCFALVWLLNWNAFGEQVPLYLSGHKTITCLAEQLDVNKPFVFADFGCGVASVLVKLAKQFPQAKFVGYETAPLSFALAKLRCLGKTNLEIKYQSFWSTPWQEYDVIYCFLSPAPMPEIAKLVQEKTKPDTLFISNTFSLPEHQPKSIIDVCDLRKTQLFVYQF